jgi:hypothetical protein
MNRETVDFASTSIKGDPRPTYKATAVKLILVPRLRQPPMNRMSCGSQPANIRLINRREKFPCSFYYLCYWFTLKYWRKKKKLL